MPVPSKEINFALRTLHGCDLLIVIWINENEVVHNSIRRPRSILIFLHPMDNRLKSALSNTVSEYIVTVALVSCQTHAVSEYIVTVVLVHVVLNTVSML